MGRTLAIQPSFRGLPKKIFLKVIQARPCDSIHDLVIHYRLRPSQYLSIVQHWSGQGKLVSLLIFEHTFSIFESYITLALRLYLREISHVINKGPIVSST